MRALAEKGLNSILVEGGPRLLGHLLKGRLFDSVSLFVKPSFGGAGLTAGSGFSIDAMADSIGIRIDSVSRVDGDLWVEGTNICSPD
jgi:diaminohydroxyphosphoribosylaminopyrimidine deaminase/5-amino-6-(5-phosphoribosylamino)uracil reductase